MNDCYVINFKLSLSIALTVVDVIFLLGMIVILYKIKGVDLGFKIFLCSFGCLLTVLVVFFWIIYAVISVSCLRLVLIYITGGLSSGALLWKLFSILFVILHWIALHCTNNGAFCECILNCANVLRFTRSTNEATERGLNLATIEEIRGTASDQALGCQGELEIQEYEEINPLPHQDNLELQGNVAYAGVGWQFHSQAALQTKKARSDLQKHHEVLELQENVAYQRPSRQQEGSNFPVYEFIN